MYSHTHTHTHTGTHSHTQKYTQTYIDHHHHTRYRCICPSAQTGCSVHWMDCIMSVIYNRLIGTGVPLKGGVSLQQYHDNFLSPWWLSVVLRRSCFLFACLMNMRWDHLALLTTVQPFFLSFCHCLSMFLSVCLMFLFFLWTHCLSLSLSLCLSRSTSHSDVFTY